MLRVDAPIHWVLRVTRVLMQDCLYVGINLGMHFGPIVNEEFTTNKEMSSLLLNGTPFHVKFIKNYCAQLRRRSRAKTVMSPPRRRRACLSSRRSTDDGVHVSGTWQSVSCSPQMRSSRTA